MSTPSAILFALAGSPPQEGCSVCSGRCRICAGSAHRGVLYERWQGSTYTDQNKLRDWGASYVCEACVWAHAWNVPPGFPPPENGKKGVNLRLYSHFWHDGEYHAWNKANKREIREWLRTPKTGPWFAAIADTGQKHVIPWTPMNIGPRGLSVRFEEQNVKLGDFRVIDAMTELLTAGVTKDELESGHFTARAWQLARGLLEAFESDWGRCQRGGSWYSLALWLSQRDEEKVADRMAAEKVAKEEKAKEAKRVDARPKRKPKGSDSARADGDASGVSAATVDERAQALGPAARPAKDRSKNDDKRGRVGDGHDANAGAGRSEQLSLFGG